MKRLALALAALLALRADMYPDASNAKLPEAQRNLGIAATLESFGARCDGVTDDAAAFAAAVAWLSSGRDRIVHVPAATCLTSATLTLGDGREQSTVTSGALAGGETAIAVASCAGIDNGDRAVLRLNSGLQQFLITSACAGGVVTVNQPVAGPAAGGSAFYSGVTSTYQGGGFAGYGACITSGNVARPAISTIKYIGPPAPTTSLAVAAAAGAASLSVADIAGIHLGNALRVVLDSGATFWTHVIETPAGGVVKIANEVPSLANSGNAVVIANNPVVRVRGWMLSPVVKNLCLDANDLAAVGLETISAYRGDFRGLSAWKYTGVGHYLHTTETYIGISSGSADNDFELYALLPQNNQTVGMWLNGGVRGNVGFSRNRFWGGNLNAGGFDAPAAAIREEFADNNIFIKAYTSPNGLNVGGAGLYRVPSFYQTYDFPLENTFLGPALIGNVVNGTATGKKVGVDYAVAYATSDGEAVPTAGMVGTTAAGKRFPEPYAYNTATVLSPTGTAGTASYVMMGLAGAYTPNSSGTVEITVSGMVTNSVAGNGINFYVSRGAGAAPANGASLAGTSCSQVYSYTAFAAGAGGRVPFTATCIASGLVLGTAYWLDLAFQAVTGGTASASGVRIAVKEL